MIVFCFCKYYTKGTSNKQVLCYEGGKEMSKIVNVNKKIENTVVGGYKKVEDTVVGSYKKIEDKFVDTFLKHDGETIEEAKKRLAHEQQEHSKSVK